MCETCGLPLPRGPWQGNRRFCTPICRSNRHRYPRAAGAISEIVAAAIRSEDLERPDLAMHEWKALDIAIHRLEVMTERIRVQRAQAGLFVPPNWPGLLPADVPDGLVEMQMARP
jgi:hypothetical protein